MADAGLMEKIVSLAKRRGFVFPGSEIYGGFAGVYDWGPYGVFLRENVVRTWERSMQEHDDIAFIDSGIFTAPEVWEASGHVSGFNDPLVECLSCHSKLRADHLLESIGINADEKMSEAELNELFDAARKDIVCPVCGKKQFGNVVQKNLMATSTLGRFSEEDKEVYLRAETAQGIYINYKNVLQTGFYKIPFGIAQVGKVFRNEISPRQFLFRKREFEQMEMQYFVRPSEAPAIYESWRAERMAYYDRLGIRPDHLRWKRHDNLVFYAKDAWDIQYEYPFGWGELEGLHYRGDYDLSQHQKFSGVDMSYRDEKVGGSFIPHVIEASVGVDRTVLMVLAEAYAEDEMNGETRVVMRFHPRIAPLKAAVFPLLKNKPELVAKAREVYDDLKKAVPYVIWDDNGNIGKRYRRQDEIGTPFCITIDFDTLGESPEKKDTVTLRRRDSGEQDRLSIKDAIETIKKAIA
ncbi:glycine--tRNA ligase [Patescibacteria group bacterium]|nr:glycine--tRNA ligase [Patescibacteria group bacterium]